ncbi:hypothetical protein BmR1_04g05680 [Babesia microti strain RI]|uniref:Bromodomain associated domain-containing protein n=1 Tax=Babesia microti (strain RI) TaxID=1133968 RepID=I7I9N2_BABMR|nr:hypothetical protein BmR1_04g05680 [Babesia microti strain RI]CCF75334.1 hypothetical protein BmR1_04g05680 [Babesia microti strain RI]|eukprot:XP_012649742.1 hypothetical protein BmR1_04g05680 [Babesia microti strain RI]
MDIDSNLSCNSNLDVNIQYLSNDVGAAHVENVTESFYNEHTNVNCDPDTSDFTAYNDKERVDFIDNHILSSKINRGTHVNNYNVIRHTYYDEWMIKTVSWIAMNIGFKQIDISAIELLSSYTIKLIQDLGRRAQTLARIRSSECCNYIDTKTALQNTYPHFYNEIFIHAKFLSIKPMPTSISSGHYHTKSQPALLANPSFLYYECLLAAGDSIANVMSKSPKIIPKNDNKYSVPINIAQYIDTNINTGNSQEEIVDNCASNDSGSIGVYVAGGYSANDEPLYQKLVMSRRKFCHKHFPILPIECFRDNKGQSFDNEYSYLPDIGDSTQTIEKQKIVLQSELPLLQ